jgi:hypothetical protein
MAGEECWVPGWNRNEGSAFIGAGGVFASFGGGGQGSWLLSEDAVGRVGLVEGAVFVLMEDITAP